MTPTDEAKTGQHPGSTKHCRRPPQSAGSKWYKNHGPVKHGSNKRAAEHLKGKEFEKHSAGFHYNKKKKKYGWAIGYKHGCTKIMNMAKIPIYICGCYETWCPIKKGRLQAPGDLGASKEDGGWKAAHNKWVPLLGAVAPLSVYNIQMGTCVSHETV